MLAPEQPLRRLTREEYLAFERASLDVKHELHRGTVVALTDFSVAHALITANVTAVLHAAIRRRGLVVLASRMRVRVPELESYVYPDVSLVSTPARFEDGIEDTLLNAVGVVEVLAPSTIDIDLGLKPVWYRRIPSICEIVTVYQNKPHAEWFTRRPDGLWEFREVSGLDASVRLPSLDVTLPLRDIYDGVDVPPSPDERSADLEPSP